MRPVQLPLAPIPSKPTPSLKRKWPGRWSPLEILVGCKVNCAGSTEVLAATALVQAAQPGEFTYRHTEILASGRSTHVFVASSRFTELDFTKRADIPPRRTSISFKATDMRISARRGWCPPLDNVLSAINGATWISYTHGRGRAASLREPVPQWFIPSYDNTDYGPPF